MGRANSHKKKIACIESLWDGNIEHRLSVVPEERAPAELVALRRRRDARAGEHVSHKRRRDGDLQLAQLADDPNIAPVAVLAREPQD